MTFNGYFALNFVFAPVWLAPIVRLSNNNCAKNYKDSTYCQRRKSSAGTLVSDNIRFVRIRSGSLEKKTLKDNGVAH